MKTNATALAAALLSLATMSQAVVVNINFSGTYDTGGDPVFGESGAAVPYSFDFVYDTALDTNTQFIGIGDPIGPFTANHEWYGYSKSGVVSSNLTFGTHTFSPDDMDPRTLAAGVSADFWFDADVATSTPTRLAMAIYEGSDELTFGGAATDGFYVWLYDSRSTIVDDDGDSEGESIDLVISVSPVPEPATVAVLGIGALALLRRKRA